MDGGEEVSGAEAEIVGSCTIACSGTEDGDIDSGDGDGDVSSCTITCD